MLVLSLFCHLANSVWIHIFIYIINFCYAKELGFYIVESEPTLSRVISSYLEVTSRLTSRLPLGVSLQTLQLLYGTFFASAYPRRYCCELIKMTQFLYVCLQPVSNQVGTIAYFIIFEATKSIANSKQFNIMLTVERQTFKISIKTNFFNEISRLFILDI